MHWTLTLPNAARRQRFLRELQRQPLSYTEKGATAGSMPPGYQHDHYQVRLGRGREVFRQAGTAILKLEHFPAGWTVTDRLESVQTGTTVLVAARIMGLLWVVNGCRVIYTVEEENRTGFAYGSLEQHIERGEEYFGVWMDGNGQVWYEVKVFSRHRHWLARLFFPFTRWYQRRFVRHSQQRLQQLVR